MSDGRPNGRKRKSKGRSKIRIQKSRIHDAAKCRGGRSNAERLIISEQTIGYRRLKQPLFFGYRITDGLAIATPEKALLDPLYPVSRGKASLDESGLNLGGLSKTRPLADSRPFPPSMQRLVREFIKRRWGKMSVTIG